MEMKMLLSAARAAGYAMALPEDFDGPRNAPHLPSDAEACELPREDMRSRALVPRPAEEGRLNLVRDWIAAIWVGRAAA